MWSKEIVWNKGRFYTGLICMSLFLLICFSYLPARAASMEYLDTDQGLTWEYELSGNNTAKIHGVRYSVSRKNVSIPKTIPIDNKGNSATVTQIVYNSNYEFKTKLASMETLYIPNTVVKIDFDAFNGCGNLTSVTFEENAQVTSFGERAFANCSKLSQFAFPSSLQIIYGSCFRKTALKNIDLSSTKVSRIWIYAFHDTFATTLNLPVSILNIDSYAFGQSAPSGHYTKYTYPGTDAQWAAVKVGGGNYLEKETVPPISVSFTTSSTVTPTNATIKAVFTASENGNWTDSGVRLYNSSGTVIATKSETHNYNMSQLSVWYDINSELGKTLSPNTTYYFEIYTHFNGELKTCTRASFKTQVKTTMTWTNTLSNVTSSSFTFTVKGKANTTGNFTSFSYVVDDLFTGKNVVPNTTVTKDVNLHVTGAQWLTVSYTPSSTVLNGGHTYAYQVSYVFEGTKYVSDRYTVTLPDDYAPYIAEKETYAYSLNRNEFSIIVSANDGCEVVGMNCYVYNSVDGPSKKVQVYPDITDSEWVYNTWYMNGWLNVNIDDVGGRRNCYYTVEVTAWDRSGNTNTAIINPDNSIYIKGDLPEVTAAQVKDKMNYYFTLSAEVAKGHYPYTIQGFRAVVYPENGTVEDGVWSEFPATFDSADSAYKGEGTVNFYALNLAESQNCNVEVYAVEKSSGALSEAYPLTAWIDVEGPRVSNFKIALGDDDILRLSCDVTDESELSFTGFMIYTIGEDGMYQYQTLEADYQNGHAAASVPFADYVGNKGFCYVETYFIDSFDNFDDWHVHIVKRPSHALLRIPEEVKTIEEEAFAGVAAEEVIIPNGCVSIESDAFKNCENLRYVTIPSSVTDIAAYAFPSGVIIICEPNSYAMDYAWNYGYESVEING